MEEANKLNQLEIRADTPSIEDSGEDENENGQKEGMTEN